MRVLATVLRVRPRTLLGDLKDQDYYAELDAALEAHRNESLFNVIDRNTGWKIDLIFRKSTAFGEAEFKRRRKIDLHGRLREEWERVLGMVGSE